MLSEYLSGRKLYGDDFSAAEIEAWHVDEADAYYLIDKLDRSSYEYGYHALNRLHGFRHLHPGRLGRVLGLGSAYGDEFEPIADCIDEVTIIEPSTAFWSDKVRGVPANYLLPSADGQLPFLDGSFNLITCLGVLHHIPNVSTVVTEVFRCLASGGTFLVREPIVSMGDWSKPRPGLTSRERGIPLGLFRTMINRAGFMIRSETLFGFRLLPIACERLGVAPYNHVTITWLDARLSKLFSRNLRYHATKSIQKLRPTSVYYVLAKD